ncbi:putative mannosyl-oligosaccharide 1,3-1,6-alpha-mannosidase [Helianthus annuus]|nr:putative mannosyl-oligosaccharide 1,3-1,6-alpha-mannosidase [Helianthus annuus]
MLYLQRYWRDALDAKKEALILFLQNGLLEIVGGDGVMNDEVQQYLTGNTQNRFIIFNRRRHLLSGFHGRPQVINRLLAYH